jgi:class 3 adenylate cyclase/predicted ATPase
MKCSRCGFESPPGFGFCGKCGQPFELSSSQLDAALSADLCRLLPADLAESLQTNAFFPAPDLLDRCALTLNDLIEEAAAFLPDHLADEIYLHPEVGKPVGSFLSGSLLYADISGFTTIAETLSQSGRDGAEETTDLANLFFASMLSILKDFGGHLISFGGDALLGLFLEPGSALQAVRAGLHMQAEMWQFENTPTSMGSFPLKMKAAVHRGRFFHVRVGSEQSMGQALFGLDVNRAAAAESAARPGQVVVDRETLEAIPLQLDVEAVPNTDAYWRVMPDQLLPPAVLHTPALIHSAILPTAEGLRDGINRLIAFTPFLPGGILNRFSRNLQHQPGQGEQGGRLAGEHRLTACLFANINGLDAWVDQMGPGQEELITQILNRYYLAMAAVVHSFDGVINKFDLYPEGEKMLVIFGAPVTHEDDAERSVRAALAMQQAASEFGKSLPGVTLSQRIGLSYGPLFAGFVGTHWRHEYTIMGDEVNLAARLMTAASAGEILVSQNIFHKVRKLADFDSRGTLTVKGKSQPVPAFSPRGFRANPVSLRGFQHINTPLIGRDTELQQMTQAARRLLQGFGQIISITGEAGMGKSRLVAEFQKATQALAAANPGKPVEWVEGRCLSYLETVSYGLFQPVLLQLTGIQEDDTRSEALQKIQARMASCFPGGQQAMASTYLANFLNLDNEDDALNPLRFLDPEAIQRGTFLVIRTILESLARSQALVLVLDDIHWIDPASRKLLESLLPVASRASVIFLLLYRPEHGKDCWKIHDLVNRDYGFCSSDIALKPLVQTECKQIMDHLLQANPVSEQTRQVILKRVDGNPLYLEEILRSFIDPNQAVGAAAPIVNELDVPDTLQGVLMTRLDHLKESSRYIAHAASTIGRSFSMSLLSRILPQLDPFALNQGLIELQQQDILHEIERIPEIIFGFKHVLMQDVCYDCLSARVRHDLHSKIARHLVTLNDPNSMNLIGHHAYAGQDWELSLEYQLLAGRQAQRLFANHEAIGSYLKALESAQYLPPARTAAVRQEINLALGELYTITTQFELAQQRLELALAAATERDDADGQIQSVRWLARKEEMSGSYPTALEWVQRGLDMAAGQVLVETTQLHITASLIYIRQGNDVEAQKHAQTAYQAAEWLGHLTAMARSNNMLGLIQRNRGENQAAAGLFRNAMQLYSDAGDTHGQGVSLNLVANALFNMGQWEFAADYYHKARDIFEQMGDRYNQAIAGNNLGGIALNQERLADAAAFYAEAYQLLSQSGGSVYVRGAVQMNLGAVCVKQKDVPSALEHLKQSQALFEQIQTRDFLPEINRHLARAALVSGDLALAKTHADEAHRLACELSMKNEEGCSLRVLGEIFLAMQKPLEAESYLRESINILAAVGEEYELAVARSYLSQALTALGNEAEAQQETASMRAVFERLGILG